MDNDFLYGLDDKLEVLHNYCKAFYTSDQQMIMKKLGILPTILLYGLPGTGKTSLIGKLYQNLKNDLENVDLYRLEFENVLSSDLGKSSKNLVEFFEKIKNDINANKSKSFIVLEEIDSFTMHRFNSNENDGIRRLMLSFNKEIDKIFRESVQNDIVIIGTTNMISNVDTAILRRFFIKEDLNIELEVNRLKEFLLKLFEISCIDYSVSEEELIRIFEVYRFEKFTLGEIKLSFARYYLQYLGNKDLKYNSEYLIKNLTAFNIRKQQGDMWNGVLEQS